MRLFLAIRLNERTRTALADLQERMRRQGVRGNFTKRENLHLTLAFIGEWNDPESVKEIIDAIDIDPFEIRLDGVGSFGSLWWAGLAGSGELDALAKRMRRELARAGIPYDRKKFTPHITLVRRPVCRQGMIPEKVLRDLPDAAMTVDHISLMRSDRGRHGMIYTEL